MMMSKNQDAQGSNQYERDLLFHSWSDLYEDAKEKDAMAIMVARACAPCLDFLDPYARDPLLLPSSSSCKPLADGPPAAKGRKPTTADAFFLAFPECIDNDGCEEDEDDGGMEVKVVDPWPKSFSQKSGRSTSSDDGRIVHGEISRPQQSRPDIPSTKPHGYINPYAMGNAAAPTSSSGGVRHDHLHQASPHHQPPPTAQPPKMPPPPPPPRADGKFTSTQTASTAHYSHPTEYSQPDRNFPSQQQQHARPVHNHGGTTNQFGNDWDAFHAQQRNPFQTAREYQQASEPPASSRPLQPRHVPQPPAEPESPQPQPPQIPESLKRKFQAPTKTQNNTVKRKRGLRSTQGPAAALTNEVENNSDDDDVPEELKRFGKELVEAIENEIIDSGEKISFQEIAGLADQKGIVQEVVCWPLKRPDLFTGLRRAPNGLLLYGPPGTGKTLIGKAIATEAEATFFSISSSSITSKWMGQGEKLVRTLFAVAAYREPSVVFIDEIDSLLTARKADENEASRRIKTEFLVQLDGVASKARVLVIGATNRPGELDEAARRRFTKRLYIPLPTREDREQLLRVLLSSTAHKLKDGDIIQLSRDTGGFSGADLTSLSADAAMGPLRELGSKFLEIDKKDVPPIALKHFKRALRGTKPSVAPQDLVHYEEWDKLYGTKRAENEDNELVGDDDDDD